jgi:hypothetical protein
MAARDDVLIQKHAINPVTWSRVVGTPSMDEINEATMDEYNRRWPTQIEQPSRLKRN